MGSCGFTIIDGDGNEEPCDRPATGWRWYQGHFHEDALDAACWEHENEGGRRMHAAEAKVAAVLAECDSVPNSQTPLWPSQIRLAIEEAAQMGSSTDAVDTTRPYAAVNDQQGETQ